MNPLVKKYKNEKRWVSWKLETRNGKQTKVPYSISGSKASSTDPKTWNKFDEIKTNNKGIVLHDKKLICIDIDHCIVNGDLAGEEREKILEFILSVNSYAEISPSGTGLHIFIEATEPFDLKANRKGIFEIYSSGRYMTYTGNPFLLEEDIKTMSPSEIEGHLEILGYPWERDVEGTIKPSQQADLSDLDLLKKVFKSKNGSEIKSLYEGNISKYNNDQSSADMAFMSHLAFWTACNPTQMESIWLSSPLGGREKTINRKDYRDRTINNAIKNCREVYVDKNKEKIKKAKELQLLFKVDKSGNITYVLNVENITRVLHWEPEFKDTMKYDEWNDVHYFKGKQMEDHHVIIVQARIQVLYPDFIKVSKDMTYDAMLKVSHDNSFDSAKNYLTSLKWDGVSRVDSWLSKSYGTPDDEYHKAVGSNWLKGLVKRIIQPGCKFDHVMVLEGEQGTKKSTSLMVLGKDWHVETTMSTDSKDFFMMFRGKAIIEFSEGETLNRTEVKRMKAIITTQSDKYRPAYGRFSKDHPRRCVFAMTTNAEEYLKDETGNRRWLPVKCNGNADIEWIEKNRDQLFAEAYFRVINKNETTWEFPDELMKEAQDLRRIHDPWEETIVDWYIGLPDGNKMTGITVGEVFEKAIHKGSSFGKPIQRYEEMSISDVLKRVLKLEKRRVVRENARTYRYYPVGAPIITMEVEPPKTDLDSFVKQLKLSNEEKF